MAHTHHHAGHTPVIHEQSDEWHRHSKVEGAPQHEHAAIASPGTITKWYFGIVATVALTVGVISWYFTSYATRLKAEKFEHEASTRMSADAVSYKAQARAELSTPKLLDPATGRVALPITIAIDKVIAQYKNSAPATPAK